VKLHKEGEYSDDALKKVEREMDIDELKLNLKVPKEK
jgi:CPA1 family monovalent cation:H+ antiporter